jgi:hypothetical protein
VKPSDRTIAIAKLAAMVSMIVGYYLPHRAPPVPAGYVMNCRRAPLTMTSTTPGVTIDPMLMCWRAPGART